jgi:hypothetical protein
MPNGSEFDLQNTGDEVAIRKPRQGLRYRGRFQEKFQD